MSGRLPRLRALRPRAPQQQQQPREQKDHPDRDSAESEEEAGMKGYEEPDELGNEGKRALERDVEQRDGVKEDTLPENGKAGLRADLDDVEFTELAEERQSYLCDTCEPPRSLPDLKAYLDHLKKEHKQKVQNDRSAKKIYFLTNRFTTTTRIRTRTHVHADTAVCNPPVARSAATCGYCFFFLFFFSFGTYHDQSLALFRNAFCSSERCARFSQSFRQFLSCALTQRERYTR